MAFKKLQNRYNQFILGENRFASLRKRSFILISWVAILFAIAGNLVNIIMGLPSDLIIFTGIINVLLVLIFIRIRTKPHLDFEKYIYLFWGLIIFTIPPSWVLNSGIDSNNIMLIFVVFVGMFLTIKQNYRLPTFIFFVLLLTFLLLLDFYYPQIIIRYANKEQRVVDLILGYSFYLALTYGLLNLTVRNNKYEHEKIILKNRQLDLLTKEKDDLNRKLSDTITELELTNHSKDRFISIIAHDLKSPFLGLLGLSRLLDNENENLTESEKKEFIRKLRSSTERLYSFLDELLLWSRIQRNSIPISNELISIKQEISSLIQFFDDNLQKKKITVEVDYNNDKLYTDRNLITTVFRNIFSNAIKFSTHGSKINIYEKQFEDKIQIHFQDSGIGISEADMKNLFKVEMNLSRSGTDGEIGTGLGLIICSEIIKKLNGAIHVESKEGKGSVFIIELPRDAKIM
jgi:signal transduction histidine kinase